MELWFLDSDEYRAFIVIGKSMEEVAKALQPPLDFSLHITAVSYSRYAYLNEKPYHHALGKLKKKRVSKWKNEKILVDVGARSTPALYRSYYFYNLYGTYTRIIIYSCPLGRYVRVIRISVLKSRCEARDLVMFWELFFFFCFLLQAIR